MRPEAANTALTLREEDVLRHLPQLDVAGALRELFLALAEERAVQPPQILTRFPGGGGDFIAYLGVLANRRVFGVKLSPYIPTAGRPIVTAWTLLMSMETGQPLLLCDSNRLTTERTAGTTALAVDLLARPDARSLAVVGSGPVAQAHLRRAAGLRDWENIRWFSPNRTGNEARRAAMAKADGRATVSASLADCVKGADVVMLCTASGTPVLDDGMLTRPALVTSISTNALDAHEIPPAWLAAMDVYCDDKRNTPASAGEMKLAERKYGWSSASVIGDLADLVAGRCRSPEYGRHAFFRSIGLGLEDVAIAHALFLSMAGS